MGQNRRAAQNQRRLAFVVILLAAVLVILRPAPSFAGSYSMPQVDIDAQVETNGSLHVVEQRVFDFDGDFTSVSWTFEDLPETAEVRINSVRMATVDDQGEPTGYPQVLESVPFVLSWRDGEGPASDAYSFDKARSTLYAFFAASDERRLIEVDYTVENGVTAYADIGEVYWKFVGASWGEPSQNVRMTLALPVPSGTEVVPGDNVRAWGHGPADGSLSVGEDGAVSFDVPCVDAGSSVEAHVVFPSSWLTNLPSGTEEQPYRAEQYLGTVLEQEEAWSDQETRARVLDLGLIVVCALVCAAVLAFGLVVYLRYGKEHTPCFKDDYWRAVPEKGIHPALLGRLWRWDRIDERDFVATLMKLACEGRLRTEWVQRPADGRGGSAGEYLIERVPAAAGDELDPLDSQALGVIFDGADGSNAVRFDDLRIRWQRNPQDIAGRLDAWQGLLSARVDERAFFEEKSWVWQKRLVMLAATIAGLGALAWLGTGKLVPLLTGIPTAAALVPLANHTQRRSRAGNELAAKCKALRNWLRDLPVSGEHLPSDERERGELLVCAFQFGVAEQAAKRLRAERADAAEHLAMDGGGGRAPAESPDEDPCLLWCAEGHGKHGRGEPAGALLVAWLREARRSAH